MISNAHKSLCTSGGVEENFQHTARIRCRWTNVAGCGASLIVPETITYYSSAAKTPARDRELLAMDASNPFDLRCLLDNVQGMVDALTCLRWKKQQVRCCSLHNSCLFFSSFLGLLEYWGVVDGWTESSKVI